MIVTYLYTIFFKLSITRLKKKQTYFAYTSISLKKNHLSYIKMLNTYILGTTSY